MTKRELKSKVEELEKELEKFKKELSKVDDDPYGDLSDQRYFYIAGNGNVSNIDNTGCYVDKTYYRNANYFSDEDFAKKVAAEQTLTNLLRKYTYEHGWSDDMWDNENSKCNIRYNTRNLRFEVDVNQFFNYVNAVYFIDGKTAIHAIKEVVIPFVKEHPELGYELSD